MEIIVNAPGYMMAFWRFEICMNQISYLITSRVSTVRDNQANSSIVSLLRIYLSEDLSITSFV